MKKCLSLLTIALISAFAMGSQNSAEAGRTGRAIGLGIFAGVATAAIISEAARAERRYGRLSCRQLYWRCERGQDWACYRFDDRGC